MTQHAAECSLCRRLAARRCDPHPFIDPHVARERDIQPAEPHQLRRVLAHRVQRRAVPRHVRDERRHAGRVRTEQRVEREVELGEKRGDGSEVFVREVDRDEAERVYLDGVVRGQRLEQTSDATGERFMVWVRGNALFVKGQDLCGERASVRTCKMKTRK